MQICGSWFQLQAIPFRMHHVTQLEQREFTNDSPLMIHAPVLPSCFYTCTELFIICPISIQPNPIFERTGGILFPPVSIYGRLQFFLPSSLLHSSFVSVNIYFLPMSFSISIYLLQYRFNSLFICTIYSLFLLLLNFNYFFSFLSVIFF